MHRVRIMSKKDKIKWDLDRYPNFSASGNISGMKALVYGRDALLVRCGDWVYNVPPEVYYAAK